MKTNRRKSHSPRRDLDMLRADHQVPFVYEVEVVDPGSFGQSGGHPMRLCVHAGREGLPLALLPFARIPRKVQFRFLDRRSGGIVRPGFSFLMALPGDPCQWNSGTAEGIGEGVDLLRFLARPAMSMWHADPHAERARARGQAVRG